MVNNDSTIILDELYPLVEEALNKRSRKFIDNIGKFMTDRHEELFAIAPYTRILFNQRDVDNIFNSLDMKESDVKEILKKCFFYSIDYSPLCAKEPYIEILMCAIRYYLKKNESKNAEITTVFLLFTGKFYASLHSQFWKFIPTAHQAIMDYVVNNMLSDKFDLKKEGTIFASMRKLASTWINTYKSKFTSSKDFSDDMSGKLLQQLRDREKSFLKNIANLYYEAADNKLYMNYETDSVDEDEFRITSNDASYAARITEGVIGVMTSQSVDIKLCNASCASIKNNTIKPYTLKSIIETIMEDKNNISKLRRIINIVICDYIANGGTKKTYVGDSDFISYSLKPKPNTKSEILLEMKELIIQLLESASTAFRNTNRIATRNNYINSLLCYLVLQIVKIANK